MKKQFILFAFFISVLNFSQNLKKEILKITKNKNATVAVSVRGFDNGFSLNIKGNEKLPMQSVFKLHIAMAVLDRIDKGEFTIDQKIFIPRGHLLPNTHSPLRDEYTRGDLKIRLSELIKYTVAKSDNNGADTLLRLIGGAGNVQKYINSLGIKDFSIKFNEEEMHTVTDFQFHNYTTVKSLNQLLKLLSEGEALSKPSTEFLLKTMTETNTGKNRLIAKLPQNTLVAHKTGTSFTENGVTAATNDAGIITLPYGKKYALSVFVSNSKENEATNEEIIADISKKVWDHFNLTHKNK